MRISFKKLYLMKFVIGKDVLIWCGNESLNDFLELEKVLKQKVI